MRSLGLVCVLPVGGQDSRNEFILTTLLKLQYLIEPAQFPAEGGEEGLVEFPQAGDTGVPSDPAERAAMSVVQEVKTHKDQLKLLQNLVAFMLQRVGVALELQALFRAGAEAVSELLRLSETLADAAKQASHDQASKKVEKTTVHLQAVENGEGRVRREEPSEISQNFKEALHTVQAQVEKVIVSVQSFYGKEQTEERRKTEEFLQALLAPEGPTGADVVAAAAVTASRSGSRALLGEQLDRSRQALMEVERRNEVLASQVQELKEKIRGEEQNADRLSKQLLLLGGSQNPALAATEEQQQREMQEQLRQLYIQYARRSALCDTLTASVEAMAGRAEAAAAQNRLRLQEAMQQLQLEQAAAASATETHTNCVDTLCGALSEDMGLTLASSEQLCTEGSELDLTCI